MLSRLKVFVFVDNFAPVTETFVYDHVVGLAKNHDVYVGCINRWNQDRFPYDKVYQLHYPETTIRRIIRSRLYKHHIKLNFFNPTFCTELSDLILNLQPDIIHCHFGPKTILLIDNLKSEVFEGPIFASFHGFDATRLLKLRPAYRRRIRDVFKLPALYPLFVSQYIFNRFQRYGLKCERGKVLYLGTDTDFFKPFPRHPNAVFTFVQISSFVEKKGHYYLIKAIDALRQKNPELDFRLILGGSGEKEEEIKRQVTILGLEDIVEFKGWMTRESIKETLNQADAFLHFSVTANSGDQEGLPISILEAMSMELPICSTFHSGIPELIDNEINGLLVNEKDIEEYAEAMHRISKWGRQPRNRNKVIAHFSQHNYLNKDLINAYEQALKEYFNNKH